MRRSRRLSSLGQYIAGLVLCAVVALVYSLAQRDRPGSVARKTMAVFVYVMGAVSAVTLVVLLACKYK